MLVLLRAARRKSTFSVFADDGVSAREGVADTMHSPYMMAGTITLGDFAAKATDPPVDRPPTPARATAWSHNRQPRSPAGRFGPSRCCDRSAR